jgi:hypothetical protein
VWIGWNRYFISWKYCARNLRILPFKFQLRRMLFGVRAGWMMSVEWTRTAWQGESQQRSLQFRLILKNIATAF